MMKFNINNDIIPEFMLSPRKRTQRHILLLVSLFLITINIFWDSHGQLVPVRERFYVWLGYFLIITFIIYFNILVLTPRLLLKNKLFIYLLTSVGLVWLALTIIVILQNTALHVNEEGYQGNYYQLVFNIAAATVSIWLLIAGTSALLLFKQWLLNNQRIGELEAATLESELKILKSQINPHFLFNMLNNINVLIKKNSKEASKVLFKLEDMFRYQINDSSKENVTLESDIHFLSDYLKLEKIRRDRFEFTIITEGNIAGIKIPPLLFIPFVENAVKHNTDSINIPYVHLLFKREENQLKFECSNSKLETLPTHDRVGGLGLKNIHRRLELLYTDRYKLKISDNKKCFNVTLILDI